MQRKHAADFDQQVLDLYDDFAHGRISRRDFLEGATKFAVGGLTAEALLASLAPNYAWAQQVAKDDPRLKTEYIEYASPKGAGQMRGYLVHPASAEGELPAVLVIHENRGLNPYIEDVARRLGIAGFLAFAPDALTPLGGYPGNDDQGSQREIRGTHVRGCQSRLSQRHHAALRRSGGQSGLATHNRFLQG
jgi:carboxymethylenebutenolidase